MKDISNIYKSYNCINHISSDYNIYKPETPNGYSQHDWTTDKSVW